MSYFVRKSSSSSLLLAPPGGTRTPRPYFHEGREIEQDLVAEAVVSGEGHGQSWNAALGGRPSPFVDSESGTEADDERPTFVKALPPPHARLHKGLKAGESSEDVLLTPSQLDDEGRRRSRTYFRCDEDAALTAALLHEEAEKRAEQQDKLLRRRLGEFARRLSEVALVLVIGTVVFCGRDVLATAKRFWPELTLHLFTIALLVLLYPLKLSVIDTRATEKKKKKLWQRFRVPASFDPATVLYPPLLPVLVALSVSPSNPDVLLPNIIIGLASLPQRLFPRSSRLVGANSVHWLVAILPLALAEQRLARSGSTKGLLSFETLVSLYPLHHALLQPLHYLTTTSLLVSELHLLSAALLNLLLLTSSPQSIILKSCLWVGGIPLFVCCAPLLRWNVTLARVPKWKLRRSGRFNNDSSSLVDAASEIISIQQAVAALRASVTVVDSDADDDDPGLSNERYWEPKETRDLPLNGNIQDDALATRRPISSVLTASERFQTILSASSSRRRRARTPNRFWCLDLTPHQALLRKRLYAASMYACVVFIVLAPVRRYIADKSLYGQDPFGWALGYLFGQIGPVRTYVSGWGLNPWVQLPAESGNWYDILAKVPSDVPSFRAELGLANVRLVLILYWAVVLAAGLLAVFSLTAYVEVDTRRKVFHGVMVAMFLPATFIDPCYCSLALALVLVIFLLLEIIRAGQVFPLGAALSRFVAPYVDGRDLRGPVVVSHIFLLIGCAVPLWFSLAALGRGTEPGSPWIDWELAGERRDVAMVAGVVCVGMGDAAASLIGRRLGRHKWPWIGGKSLEGSAAFAAAVTIGLCVAKAWLILGGWADAPAGPSIGLGFGVQAVLICFAKAAFCACSTSFMEAVLTGANDNVVVPVALWLLVKGVRL